jgi:hypothetical protein
MIKSVEVLFRRLAYRRAYRAISRCQGSSWYMGELLRKRLDTGLATPGEVLATIGSWKEPSESGSHIASTRH